MSRRGKGEGAAPIQLPDGRWQARVTLGYVNGKQKRKAVYGATRREAAEKLKAILGQSSSAILPDADKITAVAHLERFILEHKSNRAPGTIEQWKHCLRRVTPYLEHLTLERVTPASVRFALTELSTLSPATRQKTFDFVRLALEDAVRLGLLRQNPAAGVERPKGGAIREKRILQPEEVHQVLEAASGHPLERLIRLGYTYGLRIGEIQALSWDAWDASTHRLNVSATLRRDGSRHTPKSGSSGAIRVDGTTAHMLEAQRADLNALRAKQEPRGYWTPNNLVFPSNVGTPLEYHNILRGLREIFEAAGVTYAPTHVMRRTYISLALQHLNPREVADVVRHRTTRTTMDVYAQSLGTATDRAAIGLDALLMPRGVENAKKRQPPKTKKARAQRVSRKAKK
jgi:integrase